jgi:hypothetical protein
MKKGLLFVLIFFLSACQTATIEEGAGADSISTESEAADSQNKPLQTLFVSIEDLPRVYVQNLASNRRTDFVTSISEEEMLAYQEVFFIYRNRNDLQSNITKFDLPDVPPYQYIVEVKDQQRHIYLNPGATVRQMDLFQELKKLDLTKEGIFELPFAFPLLDRSRSMDDFGSIAVVTTALNDGDQVGFLSLNRHELFRSAEEALEQDFDTYLFMYEQNNDPNYPRHNFGQVLNPGEILGIEVEGKTIILLRFSSDRRPELTQLKSNVLTLKGRVRIEEYLELSKGLIFSSVGFVADPENLIENNNIRFSPLDVCRIKTVARHGNNRRTGFPYEPSVTKDQGNVRIAVIPLDFPNFPGDPSVLPIYKEDVLRAEDWSRFMTGGKMTYEIEFVEQWVRLPYGPDYYPTYGSAFQNEKQSRQEAMNQVFNAADPFIDFKDIDFAYFIFPYESLLNKPTVLYGQISVTTPRAGQIQMAIYGNENLEVYSDKRFYKHMVHETLHFQGFIGHGPCHHCEIGIMVRDNGATSAILTWEGFLANWYDEEDVRCLTKEELKDTIEYKLDSLDQLGAAPGNKNLMIPLGANEIMIIEYRTDGLYSTLPKKQHGILIYIVNTSKISNYPSPEFGATNTDPNSYWFTLMNEFNWHKFAPGQSIRYAGVIIEVIDSNVVRLSLES